MLHFITDATVWKEAFEKAKKIVAYECEIYAGKNNMEEKQIQTESEPSSDVSYSESTDNKEQPNKLTAEIENVETSEKQLKDEGNVDKVSKELEQLQVQDVEETK